MAIGQWTWLEVAKLVIQGLTPIFLILLGLFVQRALKRFEHQQWRSQKLIEKRLAIYDVLAPKFNLLLCYYLYVGPWRDVEPGEIIKLKREIDQQIHLARPLFSTEFFDSSMSLVDLCFETYTGWGKDARLKTGFGQRRAALGTNWKPEWEECFSADVTPSPAIRKSYDSVMLAFSNDLGVCDSIPPKV